MNHKKTAYGFLLILFSWLFLAGCQEPVDTGIDLDLDSNSDNKCFGIEYEKVDNGLRYIGDRSSDSISVSGVANLSSVTKMYKIKPVDRECHIGFKISGIISTFGKYFHDSLTVFF